MRLIAWLRQKRGRGRQLAKYLGSGTSTVSQYAYGQREARIATAQAIQEFTGGEVTVAEIAEAFVERKWRERT